MAKSNVRPILGLKPADKPKKLHYLFAIDDDDFAEFTGSKPYELNTINELNTRNRIYGCVTDRYVYVYCNSPEDIRGLTKIEASLTTKFRSIVTAQYVAEVQAEIQICNFISTQHFNPEHIPNVLKEVMAEIGSRSPEEYLSYPCVGMVVKSKKAFAPIGVGKGCYGIIISLYGPQLDEVRILFQNGSSTGFTKEETIEDLEFFSLTENQEIRSYVYKDLLTLYQHFEEGFFDSEFGNKY